MSDISSHNHDFTTKSTQSERRTLLVLILTLGAMTVEIIAGTVFGSMALLADGWHMGTHAAAFGITLFAYFYTRKHTGSERYSFGPGKVNVLGGYTSAIALGIVALLMLVESTMRLFAPHTIHFNEAIMIAVLGLVVNVLSMFLLGDHHHDHHHDHNLRAAYLHVLADALTSILAIIALLCGKYFGLTWMDSLMGIVGGLVILKWTLGLIKQTTPVLLDESIDTTYRKNMLAHLDAFGQVTDFHMWKVSGHHYALIISLTPNQVISHAELQAELMQNFRNIAHLTIEIRAPHHG